MPTSNYGPIAGEPPLAVDPRRWGSVIGLIGGLIFISYSGALGSTLSTTAWVIGISLFGTALFAHYVRPVSLGTFERPRPTALAIYGACVVAELALINVGTRVLTSADREALLPAMIAVVVGLHFIPFAWAFGERMFYWLGGSVAIIGAAGLMLGWANVANAAQASAVVAGLTMQVIIVLYARGRFARHTPAAGPR